MGGGKAPYRNRRKPNKKTRKRRAKKGTQSTGKALVSYSSGTQLFAPKFIGKMRYRTQFYHPFGTTDIPSRQIYRTTSINDPDESKVGFQPTTHDELALFYNHYIVLGAKITVKAILEAGHTGVQYVFLSRTDDTTTTNRNTATEMLNDANTKRIIINQEKRQGTLTHYYSRKKTFGNMRDEDLTAAFNANPAENMYWQLSTVNFQAGQAQSSVAYEVTIDYIVCCTEPKSIGLS